MDVERELQLLDRVRLVELVRQVLGDDAADITVWDHCPIYTGLGAAIASSGVFRLSGMAKVASGTIQWSLVLKVLYRPMTPTDTIARPVSGWDREVLTFRSELLDDLPPGLAAPRCFGIEERPDSTWLWLEDVADEVGPRWPLARFALAARHLGRFNGRYLDRRPLPDYPWLSRTMLRQRAERNTPFWTGAEPVRDPTLLERFFPDDLPGRARQVWEARYRLLDVLDRLPQTLVHANADRRNLFARRDSSGREETVAIDWAWTGVAAIGEELVNLVVASTIWHQVGATDLVTLSQQCSDGCVAGLADAGWRGDPRLVRVAFAVGTALRYGPLGPFASMLRHPEMNQALARATGHTPEDSADVTAAVQRFAFDQLDAVRDEIAPL
ncbi:MAG: hypothetical protein ACR2IK_20735 [Chloroflexota bacterium]